jgi:hypothetical protein
MTVLRPTQILPLPFLIPRLYSRLSTQGFHSSTASSSTTETSPRAPNPPLDIDPALQALLKDTDISILRSKTRHRVPETNKSSPLYRQPHRELEVLDVDGEGTGMTEAELVVEDEAKDLFPRSERKSPAASFGSRGIGALVLPFELQRSILRLISGIFLSTLYLARLAHPGCRVRQTLDPRRCDATLSRAKRLGRRVVDTIHLALLHRATFDIKNLAHQGAAQSPARWYCFCIRGYACTVRSCDGCSGGREDQVGRGVGEERGSCCRVG